MANRRTVVMGGVYLGAGWVLGMVRPVRAAWQPEDGFVQWAEAPGAATEAERALVERARACWIAEAG